MLNVNKGDKVILKGFTGIKLGVFEVKSTTKKTVTIEKKNGDELVFDRKTCKQINVEEGKEKYANSIMEDDGSFVAPSTAGAKRKASKKTAAKKAKVEEPELEDEEEDEGADDEEEDEEPAPKSVKKSKKTAAKKPAKKAAKKVVVEDDEDEEEDEDDDFEEVDD